MGKCESRTSTHSRTGEGQGREGRRKGGGGEASARRQGRKISAQNRAANTSRVRETAPAATSATSCRYLLLSTTITVCWLAARPKQESKEDRDRNHKSPILAISPASGLALCSLDESLFSAFGSCLSLFATVPFTLSFALALLPVLQSASGVCLPAFARPSLCTYFVPLVARSVPPTSPTGRPNIPALRFTAQHLILAHLPSASLDLFVPLVSLSLAEPRVDSRSPDHRTDRVDCASSLQPSTSTSRSPSSVLL